MLRGKHHATTTPVYPILHNNHQSPFRLNLGRYVRPRAYPSPLCPRHAFDLITVDGLVRPLALDSSRYECTAPSRLHTMYPLHVYLTRITNSPQRRMNKTQHVCNAETRPHGQESTCLILVHEFRDHYSLQARRGWVLMVCTFVFP